LRWLARESDVLRGLVVARLAIARLPVSRHLGGLAVYGLAVNRFAVDGRRPSLRGGRGWRARGCVALRHRIASGGGRAKSRIGARPGIRLGAVTRSAAWPRLVAITRNRPGTQLSAVNRSRPGARLRAVTRNAAWRRLAAVTRNAAWRGLAAVTGIAGGRLGTGFRRVANARARRVTGAGVRSGG
jgi:hypothetical protein